MVILEGVTHYQDGDMVCSQEHFAGDKAYKIKSAFEGPQRIFVLAANMVQLKSLTQGKCKKVKHENLKLFKGGTLTKTDNMNVDQPFPIYQDTKWDMETEDECKSDQNTNLDTAKYNLRPRK